MTTEIWVALIVGGLSLAGTIVSNAFNAKKTQCMMDYRLKSLEDEVRMHNNFARRMPVVEEQIKVINHRLSDMKK
jgi:hypothetical protein